MLSEFLLYCIKVNLAIILLFCFYKLFLQQDTFFQLKRFCLISILLVSFAYPFWNIGKSQVVEQIIQSDIIPVFTLPEVFISENVNHQTYSFSVLELFMIVYAFVLMGLFVRILIQLFSLSYKISQARKSIMNEQIVCEIPNLKTPFSFFRWIVLDSKKYSQSELNEIFIHENTHVKQLHSIDILLVETTCILCWLNPFAWMLRKEIRMNLEYLADRSVLNSGCEAEHYQFHLLRLSQNTAAAKLSNNFNVSPLKKRILMMNKKETSNMSVLKYALFIPICLLLVFSNNYLKANNMQEIQDVFPSESVIEETPVAPQDSVEVVRIKKVNDETKIIRENKAIEEIKAETAAAAEKSAAKPTIVDGEKVYNFVEHMPAFPGGDKALTEWLQKNIKYPEEAAQQGIQGTVYLRFVIKPDGSVSNVEVVRKTNPLLDEEAIRVVKEMPKWNPGKQKGEPVSVYFSLPIVFKLGNKEETEK